NSTNVPGVFLAFQASGGDFIPGPLSDNAGGYAMHAPPGSYQMIAGRSGYVFNRGTAPFITLGTNATVTTNLTLIPATTTLAGKIVDSANTNQGIPGIFLFWQSAGSFSVIGTTGTNGAFSLPVVPDIWRLQLVEGSCLFNQGYLAMTGNSQTSP